MAIKVKEIQETPNPNARKFVLSGELSPHPMSFLNAESAKGYQLAERLFAIEGVSSLLMLGNFVTVNKTPAADWAVIARTVRSVLDGKL